LNQKTWCKPKVGSKFGLRSLETDKKLVAIEISNHLR